MTNPHDFPLDLHSRTEISVFYITDFEWIAIALGDVVWIAVAFILGLLSRAAGLLQLVGLLSAGFLMNAQSIEGGEMLEKLSDLGIALLFFIVGLELNLGTLG